ncbi:MAG: metallophosphoesterase family protein [Bacilli bacterium]
MKIIIISDNHYDFNIVSTIAKKHPDADYYFHCGDSQMSEEDLKPFISIKGNNDFNPFPKKLVVKLNDYYSILLVHGDGYGYFNLQNRLYELAIDNACNIVAHGLTHIPYQTNKDGITILNPGSTSLPRDGISKSYAILLIEDQESEITHITI